MRIKKVGLKEYQKILDMFLNLLKEEFHEDLVSLVLYGSIARGEGGLFSDIDLLIILDHPHRNYHRRMDQILDIEERLKQSEDYERTKNRMGQEPYFSFLIFSKREAQENRYVFLDMIEDAKILYDKDNFFKKRLQAMKLRLKELGSEKVFLEDGSWYWDLKPDLKIGEVFSL